MSAIRSRLQHIMHRCVAVLVVMGCALVAGAALAPSASAAAPAPAAASVQPAAVKVVAAATWYGDWCGPGHDNWKSWWVPDHFGRASFTASCHAHDLCYGRNSWTNRKVCDDVLKTRKQANCRQAYGWGVKRSSCYAVASTYHFAIRHWAKKSYKGHGNPA